MRTSSIRGLGRHGRLVSSVVLATVVVAACGSSAPPSAAPTVRPTPTATPDPHLSDPTTADAVYLALGGAGLRMTANNANAGGENADLVKRINATYLGWPLNISEYRSSAALAAATDWKSGEKPGQGEAPLAIAGANILVTWGPQTGEHPSSPEGRQVEGLTALVTAMDRLLSPIRARSVVAVTVPGGSLGASSAGGASPGGTTAQGEATAAP
jgi:hypothetical protein